MRIDRRTPSLEEKAQLDLELAAAIARRGVEGRVCGAHCVTSCPRCGSTCCQCLCARDCPHAPSALSSDRAFPLERAITPLVFEMKRSGAFEPCWSCEGHLGPGGELWKRPSVWFYCNTSVSIRLLGGALAKLNLSGALTTSWRVSVTFSDVENPDVTFALEPDPHAQSTLTQLQADADTISRSLAWLMASEAQALADASRRTRPALFSV